MSEQELNLVEFAAGKVAQSGAGAIIHRDRRAFAVRREERMVELSRLARGSKALTCPIQPGKRLPRLDARLEDQRPIVRNREETMRPQTQRIACDLLGNGNAFARCYETLRVERLEYVPEKVLYATDAYPFAPPDLGWEEAGYVADKTGREALGIALTGMMRDHEITRDRASELALMVLRDNARKLYRLK